MSLIYWAIQFESVHENLRALTDFLNERLSNYVLT